MPSDFAQQYWEGLRGTWKDAFVTETIQQLNQEEYVWQLSKSIGFDPNSLQLELDKLDQGSSKGLGWKIFDRVWQRIFEQIQDVREDLSFDIPHRPIIGTLSTGRINALALTIPNHPNHILAFEVGLINFTTFISRYAAHHLIPSQIEGNSQSFQIREEIDPDFVEKLVDMMVSYYQTGIPFMVAEKLLLSDPQKSLAVGFRSIMELFVAGHEYGHVGLGHLEGGETKALAMLDGMDCSVRLTEDFQHEYQADQVGFLISLVYYLKKGLPYYFSAAVIMYFLKFSSLIYQGLSIILNKKIADTSHPSIPDRMSHLEGVLTQLIADQDQEFYLGMRQFYQGLLGKFEERLKERLSQVGDQLELAPVWTALARAWE